MSVDVVCGKCVAKIANMRMLKSIKDVMRPYNSKCPSCGQTLSPSEFSVDVQKN
jgi:DNA repair exonuclease SbcCD ATPase subunit